MGEGGNGEHAVRGRRGTVRRRGSNNKRVLGAEETSTLGIEVKSNV